MTEFKKNDNIQCSFCGKRLSEIYEMIAGNKVFVCDECVELAISLLLDRARKQVSKETGNWKKNL